MSPTIIQICVYSKNDFDYTKPETKNKKVLNKHLTNDLKLVNNIKDDTYECESNSKSQIDFEKEFPYMIDLKNIVCKYIFKQLEDFPTPKELGISTNVWKSDILRDKCGATVQNDGTIIYIGPYDEYSPMKMLYEKPGKTLREWSKDPLWDDSKSKLKCKFNCKYHKKRPKKVIPLKKPKNRDPYGFSHVLGGHIAPKVWRRGKKKFTRVYYGPKVRPIPTTGPSPRTAALFYWYSGCDKHMGVVSCDECYPGGVEEVYKDEKTGPFVTYDWINEQIRIREETGFIKHFFWQGDVYEERRQKEEKKRMDSAEFYKDEDPDY